MSELDPQQRQILFDQFLRCLDREENLIHYRMTWGLQWNLGFLAAVAAIGTIESFEHANVAQGLLAACGIVASVLAFIGIRAAHKQSRYLIKMLEHKLHIRDSIWDETEFIRPYGDPDSVHPIARTVSAIFPLIFAALWIVIIVYVSGGETLFRDAFKGIFNWAGVR